MKKFLLFIFMVGILSCTSDGDGGDITQGVGPWNLVNIKGGVNGSDTDVDRGQITWVFNDLNGKLFVTNNIGGIPTGVDDGEHDFRVESSGNEDFLIIDDEEYAAMTLSTTTLTLNQNITSTGSASDKYILRFVR
ncbi:MAG: hypothetical protein HKN90_09725 [Flavobacteriaceae bacterium]|nr:hypothetical protein [Flavobacteriaceae bacterium]